MSAGKSEEGQKPPLVGRAEWIILAFFFGVGLFALPFVHDAFMIQRIWLTICSAVGIS